MAADKAVKRDPKTGEFGVVGAEPESNVPDSGLCASFFEEDDAPDNGKKFYSTFVMLGGYKVYINELSRKQYKEYRQRETKVSAEINEIGKMAQSPDVKDKADEINARSDELTNEQMRLYDWVVEQSVVDWDLPSRSGEKMPCTTEAREAMRPSHKVLLAELIAQKSALGKSQSDF